MSPPDGRAWVRLGHAALVADEIARLIPPDMPFDVLPGPVRAAVISLERELPTVLQMIEADGGSS